MWWTDALIEYLRSFALVQITEVIKQDGVDCACILYPNITDPKNFECVLRVFKWEEERQEVLDKLKLDENMSEKIVEEEQDAKKKKEDDRVAYLEASKYRFAAGGEVW